MADQVRINGNMHGWSSTIFRVAGTRFWGFKSIDYGDKRERVKAYGMGRHYGPRGRTAGKYTTDPLKIKVFSGSAQELRNLIAALAVDGTSIGNVNVPMTLQLVEFDDTPLFVEFDRCALAGITSSHEESTEPAAEDWEFDVMLIRRNGQTLYDTTEGSP